MTKPQRTDLSLDSVEGIHPTESQKGEYSQHKQETMETYRELDGETVLRVPISIGLANIYVQLTMRCLVKINILN